MKKKQKRAVVSGPWDIAALVLAGLLYLIVAAFLVLAVAGIGLLIVYALEMGVAAGVLLLAALALYLPGKRRMESLPRRLLLGALIAGGAMLLLFSLAIGALVLYTAGYTAGS